MTGADASATDAEAGDRTIGVAIPIPDPYSGQLQQWRKLFGDPMADAIPPHVTLLPPTTVAASRLPLVDEHLREVAAAAAPFEMRLFGTGSFRPASPVVFVALVAGQAECAVTASAVRRGPLHRNLSHPYHPHVTVAHDVAPADLDRACEELAEWSATFPVWGFSRYEHGPDGRWRPQRDFVFGSPPADAPTELG